MIAAKPQGKASSAKERRRAAALAATERAISVATPEQLQAIAERLLALAIAARMAKRPREEQAARNVLALAERRLAELRGATDSFGARVRLVGHRAESAKDEIC
ncbi:MAG: hypothetical protein AB7F41_09800 [Methylocystis sp.]|uniref:hypothetical protein n=1 Tax=Methylocystis sp. TaxID=1911079 RepID=UPI003D0A721E